MKTKIEKGWFVEDLGGDDPLVFVRRLSWVSRYMGVSESTLRNYFQDKTKEAWIAGDGRHVVKRGKQVVFHHDKN